jgi:hypothetical protein
MKGITLSVRQNLATALSRLMRFRLTYDGVLPARRARKSWAPIKWQIREQISSQLSELYNAHPAIGMRQRIVLPGIIDLQDEKGSVIMSAYDVVSDPITVGGHKFLPLVRRSIFLSCELDVMFLRKQMAGRLLSGGDIDNRMQILFDALRMPDRNELAAGLPSAIPTHYLLEDDSLVTSIAITTDRLLSPRSADPNHALLLIDVTVSVMQLSPYNVGLLGN